MEKCENKECLIYFETADNNCDTFTDVTDCDEAMAFKARTPSGAKVVCCDGLEARVGRVIFLSMKPGHMVMEDWDSGKTLGENNNLRKRIEMAARLSIIEMESL